MVKGLPHPAARPVCARVGAPRYLLRDDGQFVAWSAALAKKAGLRAFDALPDWYLAQLKEVGRRDARLRQVQLDQHKPAAAPLGPAVDEVVPAQAQAQVRRALALEMIATARSKKALRPFFAERGVKADFGKPLEELRRMALRLAREGDGGKG